MSLLSPPAVRLALSGIHQLRRGPLLALLSLLLETSVAFQDEGVGDLSLGDAYATGAREANRWQLFGVEGFSQPAL